MEKGRERIRHHSPNSRSRGGKIPVIDPPMKTLIASVLVVLASVSLLCGQAEQVKGKAKDLKKKIEAGQTNQVEQPNQPPAKK